MHGMCAVSADCEKIGACGCTHTHAPTCASNWNLWQLCEHFGLEKYENCPRAWMTNALLCARCNDKHTVSAECINVCAGYESADSHYIHARKEGLRQCALLCKDVLSDSKWRQYIGTWSVKTIYERYTEMSNEQNYYQHLLFFHSNQLLFLCSL